MNFKHTDNIFPPLRLSFFCLTVSVLPTGSCLRRLISTSDDRAALPPGSDGFHSADFAGLCLRETYFLESFSPEPIHLRFSSSLTNCLSLCTSDDSFLQLIWFLHLQIHQFWLFGSSPCEDWFFRGSSSPSAEFRRLLWFRWKEVVPRLDPCSLIAGRS
ncbi:hypothetical protein Bca101_095475 [Brassica carinata]